MKSKNIASVLMTVAALAMTPSAVAADVVVVVGAKSAVGNLTTEQVSQLFLSKTNAFPGGTLAVPLDQTDGTAERTEFYAKVTKKTAAQLNAYRSNLLFSGKGQAPKEVAGNANIKKLVADNPNMIGYIEKSAVDSSVKVVLTP
ncbi:MAG TPA: phosphate ABC transporter substrate-binding protein [Gallionella sp.]|nr:phosphate ABC transporter substrate-binding protein [Gallionella sp.]